MSRSSLSRWLRLLLPLLLLLGLMVAWKPGPLRPAINLSSGLVATPEASDLEPRPLLSPLEDLETLNPARFHTPQPQDRPWLRWFWPGTEVAFSSLLRELDWIAAQGFGGVEIQITGKGIAPEARLGAFRDPRWQAMLRRVAHEAAKRKLGLDWVLGPGLPADYVRGMHSLTWGEQHVLGGNTLSIPLPAPEKPPGHIFAGTLARESTDSEQWLAWAPDSAQLMSIWAIRARQDGRSPAFWNFTDAILADSDSSFLLNRFVRNDSLVGWQAPPGYWKILAIYDQPTLQRPFHSVAAFPEVAADPLNPVSWLEGIAVHPAWQALPVDRNRGRAVRFRWAAPAANRLLPAPAVLDSLAPFSGKMPYVVPQLLIPGWDHAWLDALAVARSAEYRWSEGNRPYHAQYDAFVEEQILPATLDLGAAFLHQHGFRQKIELSDWHRSWYRLAARTEWSAVDAWAAGGSRAAVKWASSGAWHRGASQVTGTAYRQPFGAFTLTPKRARTEADRLLLAGVNEILVHGLAHQTKAYPDWQPDATSQLPRGQFGAQFALDGAFSGKWPQLWSYLARLQYLLRIGEPAADVLVYYPFSSFPVDSVAPAWRLLPDAKHDAWERQRMSALTDRLLPPAEDSVRRWLSRTLPYLEALEDAGYSWAWVDGVAMAELNWQQERIQAPGFHAKGLLIPESGILRPHGLSAIQRLQAAGAPVVLLGTEPPTLIADLPAVDRERTVAQAFYRLRPPVPVQHPAGLLSLLAGQGLLPAVALQAPAKSVRQVRRLLQDGSQIMLLVNLTEQNQRGEFSLPEKTEKAIRLDAERGLARPVTLSRIGQVAFQLAAGESQAFYLFADDYVWPDSLTAPREDWLHEHPEQRLDVQLYPIDRWEWAFRSPSDGRVVIRSDTGLWDWRDDPELQCFHGEVGYQQDIFLSELAPGNRWVLDLGTVHGWAEVRVNTYRLPGKGWHPFRMDISRWLRPGLNTIEVWVKNCERNAWVGRARDGDPEAAFLLGKASELVPGGLLGPVLLWSYPSEEAPTPLALEEVEMDRY